MYTKFHMWLIFSFKIIEKVYVILDRPSYKDYCKFGFNSVTRYVYLVNFDLFRAVLKLGHWKVNPEFDSNLVLPYFF